MPSLSAFHFRPPHPPPTVAHGHDGNLSCMAGSLLLADPARATEIRAFYGDDALAPLSWAQVAQVIAHIDAVADGGVSDVDELATALVAVPPRVVGQAVQTALGAF